MGEVIQGRFRRTVSRIMGSTLQRAASDYDCSKCDCPIFAGEEYIREVHLFKYYDASGVWTTVVSAKKLHCHCPDEEHKQWLEDNQEDETDIAKLA